MFSDMQEEWEHRLVEKTKKETAREIIDKIKELSQEKVEQTLFGVYKRYVIGSVALNRLAKQYGVEVKE